MVSPHGAGAKKLLAELGEALNLMRTREAEGRERALGLLRDAGGAGLDAAGLASVRNLFFKEETGRTLQRRDKPPRDALWPGTQVRPALTRRRPACARGRRRDRRALPAASRFARRSSRPRATW